MQERQVGDISIARVIESERPDFDAGQFFPSITPERWEPYRQRLAGWALDPTSNALTFPMQSSWCAPGTTPSWSTPAWATTSSAPGRRGT